MRDPWGKGEGGGGGGGGKCTADAMDVRACGTTTYVCGNSSNCVAVSLDQKHVFLVQ